MLYAEESWARRKDLHDWTSEGLPEGIRVSGIHLTLDAIKERLMSGESGLQSIGLPVEFVQDQIQYGKNFSKHIVDCIVLKNTDHPSDYFHFTFAVRTTGNTSFIALYRSGYSPLNEKRNVQNQRKESDSLFQNVLGAISGVDSASLSQEDDYYTMVSDCIRALLM